MKVTQICLGDFFLGRVPAAALPNDGPRFPLYPRHAGARRGMPLQSLTQCRSN